MAVVAAGTITFDTTAIDSSVTNVVINQMADTEEITSYDDTTWRTFIATLKSFDGSLDLLYDAGNTAAVGDSGTLAVTLTNGPSYSGTVIITGINLPAPKGGVLRQAVTFRGTGALS